MYHPKIDCLWNLQLNHTFNKKIEILIDKFYNTNIPEDTIRIIILQEPFFINNFKNILLNNENDRFYSYIFTYDKDLLLTHPKASLFLGISSWIKDFNLEKKFGVSTLVGNKNNHNLEGYRLRHEILNRENEITIPNDVYLSTHSPLNISYFNHRFLYDDKSIMFDNQYHLVIENTSMDNMFTEKLIDCFQTKTIPIYYGCPNISEYFNINGIIQVETIDEVIIKMNNLTPEDYLNKIEYIEENYNKSIKYRSYENLLINKINEIINE